MAKSKFVNGVEVKVARLPYTRKQALAVLELVLVQESDENPSAVALANRLRVGITDKALAAIAGALLTANTNNPELEIQAYIVKEAEA